MANGSMRRRGRDAWERRVYLGTDPESRPQRWLTKTVHGSARYARGQLAELATDAGRARLQAGTLSDLLERWFEVASTGWAASTVSHTRTVIECYLRPYLGHLPMNKITTEDIDDLYAHLLRSGGKQDQPLAPGSVARVHGVLHRALRLPRSLLTRDLDGLPCRRRRARIWGSRSDPTGVLQPVGRAVLETPAA